MIVGYSDGGGLAMYMGYHSSLVTKSVSIDYWAYGAYESWLSTSSQVNAVIYTTCGSGVFDDGPLAVLPDASPTGQTYVSGAGLTAGTIPTAYSTFGGGAPAGAGDWWPFSWADGAKSITMHIHGLGSAPTSLGNSESSHWQSLCTADGFVLAGVDPHHYVMGYIDVAMEVAGWLSGTTSRRQLEEPQLLDMEKRQLYTTRTYMKDAATEAVIATRPYAKASYGSFSKRSFRYPSSARLKFKSIASKMKPAEKSAMDFLPGKKPKLVSIGK